MRLSRLAAAGGKIFLSRVGQVAANAAVVMIVAQTLGPTGQGHYSLTVAVAQLASALLAGGLGLAAVPVIRQDLVPARRMALAQLLWSGVMVVVLLALAWQTVGGEAARWFADHLGWWSGMGFLAAGAAAGVLGYEIFSYDLLARGRLVVGAAINGGRALGHLVLVLALGAAGMLTFGRAVGAFAVAQVLGAAVLMIVVLREVRRPRSAPPVRATDVADDSLPPDLHRLSLWGLIRYSLRRGWVGQLSAMAYFLLLRLDQGLLEHFRGAAEVGIYSVAVYVGEMLWLLPGAMTPLLVHTSAASAADPGRDRTAFQAARAGFLVTLAVAAPLWYFSDPLLTLLAGGSYAGSGPALRALLPGIVCFAPGAVLAGDFIGRGKPHWNTQASVLTVAVNVAVGVAVIPEHGAVGAAWASSLAYACGASLMVIRFGRATGLPARTFFGR